MLNCLKKDQHKRVLLTSVLVICVPTTLYLGASVLGWIGCSFGYPLEMMFVLSWPFLGLYLIVALIFGRLPAKIKVVYFLLLIICFAGTIWSIHAHPFLTVFERRLKRVYNDVPELQTWAIDILNSNENQDYTLNREDYPEWIKKKEFPEPFIRIYNEVGTKHEYVELVWNFGSQFGQFGLVVGRPGLPKEGKIWVDGVYFFVQPQPYGWQQ